MHFLAQSAVVTIIIWRRRRARSDSVRITCCRRRRDISHERQERANYFSRGGTRPFALSLFSPLLSRSSPSSLIS